MLIRNSDHGIALGPVAQGGDPAQIDRAARELEGVFAKMMIGAMRQASMGDSLFPDENTHFRDMYDDQIAKSLAEGPGLGLAPMIRRQLGGGESSGVEMGAVSANGFPLDRYQRPMAARDGRPTATAADADAGDRFAPLAGASGTSQAATLAGTGPTRFSDLPGRTVAPAAATTPGLPSYRSPLAASAAASRGNGATGARSPEAFVAEVWPHAQRAAEELGVCPKTIVAQAALETGWGRRMIGGTGDGSANNLFGIKASGRWQGRSAQASTREVYGGVETREVASFRAYGSVAESFRDYVDLLKNSPRYADAIGSGDGRRFAQGLQRAGYATDPQYAAKLTAIAEGPTLQRALAQLEQGATASAAAPAPADRG